MRYKTKCARCGKKVNYSYMIEYTPLDEADHWDCTMREQKDMEFEICKDCFEKLFDFFGNAVEEIPYEEVIAIDFSEDVDKPSKVQTKDGEWHENCIITGVKE